MIVYLATVRSVSAKNRGYARWRRAKRVRHDTRDRTLKFDTVLRCIDTSIFQSFRNIETPILQSFRNIETPIFQSFRNIETPIFQHFRYTETPIFQSFRYNIQYKLENNTNRNLTWDLISKVRYFDISNNISIRHSTLFILRNSGKRRPSHLRPVGVGPRVGHREDPRTDVGQLKVLVGERASVDRLTPFSPRAAVGKIKNKTDDVRKRVYRAGYSKEIPGTWYEYKITSK